MRLRCCICAQLQQLALLVQLFLPIFQSRLARPLPFYIVFGRDVERFYFNYKLYVLLIFKNKEYEWHQNHEAILIKLAWPS